MLQNANSLHLLARVEIMILSNFWRTEMLMPVKSVIIKI